MEVVAVVLGSAPGGVPCSTAGRRARALGSAGALLLALTGCSGSTPFSSAGAAGSDDLDLSGPAWQLTSGDVRGEAIEVPEGYRITLSAESGEVLGDAGCNGYGARLRVSGSQVLVGPEIGATQEGCEPDVLRAEEAYLSALPLVRTGTRDGGRLELSGNGVTLVFSEQDPVPVEGLVGTPWVLTEVVRDGSATRAAAPPADLLLRPDGTVRGGTGCRTVRGVYVVSGDEVVLSSFSADDVACDDPLAEQDALVVEVLGDGFTAEVDGGTLTLTSRGGAGLVYARG